MRDPGNNYLKAWSGEYEERPFFFEEKSDLGTRLIAWSEEPEQTQRAFFAIIDTLPWDMAVLLKICVGRNEEQHKSYWARYHRVLNRSELIRAIQANEKYVFSDGMHQLCLKDPEGDRCLAFDDHGILFIYSPQPSDAELFRGLGFEERYVEPLYAKPHYQITPKNSEAMQQKFVADLQLETVESDLDR